ncbi:replication initiator, partial [Streptomyces sp. NPDC047525]|uniref:replication initiator n=1 Tax=Streptomyces sp. NPDC047525 TaxID=3155264 RepID=UPI0033E35A06
IWATAELLEQVVRSAADMVEVHTPYSPATGEHDIRWGRQLDVHPIRSDAFTESAVTDSAVAAYVAKYVSKSVGDSGGVDYRITDAESIRLAPVNAHVRALMGVCWRLGGLPELAGLRLRSWTHTLGYRGHILTKSRRYSTTYGALRTVRAEHQSGGAGIPDGAVTDSAWHYVGSGHTLAEADIAAGIAEDLALSKRLAAEVLEGGEVWP